MVKVGASLLNSSFIIPSSLFKFSPFSPTFAVLSQTMGVVTCGRKVAGRWLLVSHFNGRAKR